MQEINILSEYGGVLKMLDNAKLGAVIRALIDAENGTIDDAETVFKEDKMCAMIYDIIVTAHNDYYTDCFKVAVDKAISEGIEKTGQKGECESERLQ